MKSMLIPTCLGAALAVSGINLLDNPRPTTTWMLDGKLVNGFPHQGKIVEDRQVVLGTLTEDAVITDVVVADPSENIFFSSMGIPRAIEILARATSTSEPVLLACTGFVPIQKDGTTAGRIAASLHLSHGITVPRGTILMARGVTLFKEEPFACRVLVHGHYTP